MASPYETKFNSLRSTQSDYQDQINKANQKIAELEIEEEREKKLAIRDHRAGKREDAKYHLGRMHDAKEQIDNTGISIQYLQRQIADINNTISTVRKKNTVKTLPKGGRLTRRRRARTRRSH